MELSGFTRRIPELLSDEEYAAFQRELVERPERGKVIPGSGGLRKVRWGPPGKGRRGGLRVIYAWFPTDHTIFLLRVYQKTSEPDLSRAQLRRLAKAMRETER